MRMSDRSTEALEPWEGRCHVLSLDGGGLRGISSAAALAAFRAGGTSRSGGAHAQQHESCSWVSYPLVKMETA